MKNTKNIKYSAFTLIELLVSTAIILVLILAAAPSLDKVQSKNRLRGGAEILQNCVSRAKSLALAPETNTSDLESYTATLYASTFVSTASAGPNQCLVYEVYKNITTTPKLIDTYRLSNSVQISPFNNTTPDQFTYTFENKNHGLATRKTDPNGNPDPTNEMNDFSVQDEKLNCQQIKFFYETGEILLEKLGIMDSSGSCIGS